MQAVDETLFTDFADALNGELMHGGATLRVDRGRYAAETVTLIDRTGRTIGQLPDYADAAIILAIEKILYSENERYRSSEI